MSAFRPAQAQRWDIFAGFAGAMATAPARRELRGWCALGLAALAVAGVFALLIALSRVPGVEDLGLLPLHFFNKGLVIHVIFSFVVWFLSVLGALITVAAHRISDGAPRGTALGRAALWLACGAAVCLFVPGFFDGGEASLNNYIPVILHPLYYVGLAGMSVGVGLAVLRLLLCLPRRSGPLEPVSSGTVNGGILYLLAMLCMLIAGAHLAGDPVDSAFFELLFWGGGHILQFVNVALLVGAWYLLGGLSLGRPLTRPNLISLAHVILLAAAFLGPLFYGLFETFSIAQREAFTWLQYAFAPPTVFVAAFAVTTILEARREAAGLPWRDPALLALVMSMAVFALGGLLGMFVDGADTRTPAHYHGVIGGVNIAFMGLFYCFLLPLLERTPGTVTSRNMSIWFYAIGQALHSLGLFLAGGYGAPRKAAGADQGVEAVGALVGLYGMGIGAVVAVTGGVLFIWICGRALVVRH